MIIIPSLANACNVPVFRYALERWQPDVCEIVVFHDGDLSPPHTRFVQHLMSASFDNDGTANVKVRQQNIRSNRENSLAAIWASLNADSKVSLPCVVVRSLAGHGRLVNNWRGSIDDAMKLGLLQSPVRQEISRRLYSGDSVVWLVLKSPDKVLNRTATDLLRKELERLSQEIPLPDGIGLPGSELLSEIPLLMKFSVLEIDPNDAKEQLLVTLLHGLDPESKKAGEPLIVPVFGRGRVLEVIPASQVDVALIEDLTLYLCRACSCQVKEQNPGFDLLLNTDWNRQLYGDDAEDFALLTTNVENKTTPPALLDIPPGTTNGNAGRTESAGTASADSKFNASTIAAASRRSTTPMLWCIIVLVGCVLAIVVSKTFRG